MKSQLNEGKLPQVWSLFVVNFERITVPSPQWLALILEEIFVHLFFSRRIQSVVLILLLLVYWRFSMIYTGSGTVFSYRSVMESSAAPLWAGSSWK